MRHLRTFELSRLPLASCVRRAGRIALSTLVLLAAAAPARAQLIGVSNLGEHLDYESNVVNFAAANSFTTGNAVTTLTSVTIAAFANPGGTSGLRLRADAGGLPGALIEDFGTRTIGAGPSNPTYTSVGRVLQPNTTYWLTLGEAGSGSGGFQWDGTISTNQFSPVGWTIGDQALSSSNGGSTWQQVNFGPPNESNRFAVNIANVPEPGSLLLGAFGLGNALMVRAAAKRRRGQVH